LSSGISRAFFSLGSIININTEKPLEMEAV
jgi:hypothetical protein